MQIMWSCDIDITRYFQVEQKVDPNGMDLKKNVLIKLCIQSCYESFYQFMNMRCFYSQVMGLGNFNHFVELSSHLTKFPVRGLKIKGIS